MADYRRNHYVPVWLQKRFLIEEQTSFKYLNTRPKKFSNDGHAYFEKSIQNRGPVKSFVKRDLYTAKVLGIDSTEIERLFFGEIDTRGKAATEFFANYDHSQFNEDAFRDFVRFMTTLRLRTPKGLSILKKNTGTRSKNELLARMIEYQQMNAAQLSEGVWSIVDATESDVKFLVSDHPVASYNPMCFPKSKLYRSGGEPDLGLCGTQLLFPLSLDKLLIVTNLSWARNPYQNPLKRRPNSRIFGDGMFNWLEVQVGRKLSSREVTTINHIIKSGANRHVAACNSAWLYPEKDAGTPRWDEIAKSYMLMPDPRSMTFSTTLTAGNSSGAIAARDEYGRLPGQAGFADRNQSHHEFNTFHAFIGEYARKFGPKRRGRIVDFDKPSPDEDSARMHQINLDGESFYKSLLRKA